MGEVRAGATPPVRAAADAGRSRPHLESNARNRGYDSLQYQHRIHPRSSVDAGGIRAGSDKEPTRKDKHHEQTEN